MKWQIPAKTFLLGEYAALAEASAIILTTTPYFELGLTDDEGLHGIHSLSPAGLLWEQEYCSNTGLAWLDPYEGRGGVGASSAQFLACYLATCHLKKKKPALNSMLNAYYQSAWKGKGIRPSGYDVIAQSQQGCVYINKYKNIIQTFDWPFKDLSFLLLHTGIKLKTHNHLEETTLPASIDRLSNLVDEAKIAFEQTDGTSLIRIVNDYHQMLLGLNLVADHSIRMIQQLKGQPEILAIKGCGALGSDIVLIITLRKDTLLLREKLKMNNWSVLASEENLSQNHNQSLLENSL